MLKLASDEIFGLSVVSTQVHVENMTSKCLNMTDIKTEANNTLYPNVLENQNCVIMMITNLVEPDWLPVNCSAKVLHLVICVVTRHNRVIEKTNRSNVQTKDGFCSPKALVKSRTIPFGTATRLYYQGPVTMSH